MISEAKRQDIIRELGCLVPGCRGGPIHLHHVRTAANSGTGKKPPNDALVPLCFAHHALGHRIGFKSLERMYRLDLAEEARKLAQIDREMP